MQDQRQQLIDRINQSQYVLVTVSKDPSVDQLAAAIGLTLLINKLNKHGTAVFSGAIPDTLDFLRPEDTLEKNTDSLRDFIIALDKSKADKLRYKVEDQMVRIFITPYRTSISEKDLNYQQGDFNVDMVIAIGVHNQPDIDEAIQAHGSIMHDAVVTSIAIEEGNELGSVTWTDTSVSSLCEMITNLAGQLGQDLIDGQIATALLTGIVATTDRFSNNRTTPNTMTTSALLMSSGANQQLIASELSAGTALATELSVVDSTGAEDMSPEDHKDQKTIEIPHDLLASSAGQGSGLLETVAAESDKQEAGQDVENALDAPKTDDAGSTDQASPVSPDGKAEDASTETPAETDSKKSAEFSDKLLDSELLNPADDKKRDTTGHKHIMTHKELVLPPVPSTENTTDIAAAASAEAGSEAGRLDAAGLAAEPAGQDDEDSSKVFVSAVDNPESQQAHPAGGPEKSGQDQPNDKTDEPSSVQSGASDTASSADTAGSYMSLDDEPEPATLPPLELPAFEALTSEPPEKPSWQASRPQPSAPAPAAVSAPSPKPAAPLVTDIFRPSAEPKASVPQVVATPAMPLPSNASEEAPLPAPTGSTASQTPGDALDSARSAVASALEGAIPGGSSNNESQPYQPAPDFQTEAAAQAVAYTPPPQPQHHGAPVGAVGSAPPAAPPPIFPA